MLQQRQAQIKVSQLYAEGDRLRQIATGLPDGKKRDDHMMRAERLADLAWSIEEQSDLEPIASGLWKH